MIRCACHCSLGMMIVLIVSHTYVSGQDKVERRDRKTEKNLTVSGKITEESAAGVKMKMGGKEEVIPASDIVRIFYDSDVPATIKQAWYSLFINEEKEKDLTKVLKDYKDFVPKAAVAPAAMKRYIEYRIAMLETSVADTEADKEQARKDLTAFITTHNAGWEYPFAARALARLQVEKPDYEAAQKTLEGLVRSMLVPAEIKQEAEVLLIDVLFQANKIDVVKAKIAAALSNPNTPPLQKSRYSVYQIGIEARTMDGKVDEVVKKLEGIIASSNDPVLKALAYNIIGDTYMKNGRKRDAMWSYLWVDVVYSQDKNEHLKAMNKLMKIFEDDKDNEKVQLYKDKLARLR